DKSLKSNAKSAVKLERYFLKFIPYYSGISAVHSMKTIEQYRKNLWDMIPSIAVECTTFLILFVALTTFISWLSVYFFLFYATVFIIFYIYRTRLYKYLLKLESASNHVLNMRVLNVMSRINIPFINNKYLYDRYVNKYGIALNCEDRIARFNFYWDELTKIISFFSLFILFLVSFYSISNSQLNPSYMTVLFILSSRLSGSISQMVTRLSYYNISVHHIKESFSSLINDDVIKLEKIDKVGIQLQTIKKIKVQDLTLTTKSLDKLITGGSAKFHRGGIYGIKGKVGSGKSTFLRALVGIESIEKGKIEYDGVDINILDSSFFKNHVSYVSASDNQLFPGSLYENFVYRNCNTKRIMDTILSECFGERVFDYQSLYVDDIETIAMSTGQKRKLIFLLSLLDQSKLYIFDEVLVNLPKEDIEKSISIMRQFSRDSIIILASHSDAILNACDLVYEINEGTIDVGR
ncbi:ATP-binding cassette domain-containing protein, partial [Vibrio sp. ER1A]|uniref:ATP-binding cassette domain-containing protein n=2 Tax=Vibrio TaxID=662 RepID=UPI0004DCE253